MVSLPVGRQMWGNTIPDQITSDDILGKEALDMEGELLGVVAKLHIDNKTKQIIGITVDQGFMKPDIFIGIDFVKHFGIDAILLKHIQTDKFKGLEVMTAEGKHLGIVKEVIMNKANVRELVVDCKGTMFSKQLISIPAKDIKEIGASVVLKKGYEPKMAEPAEHIQKEPLAESSD